MTAEQLAYDDAWLEDSEPGELPEDGWNTAKPCPWIQCRYHLLHEHRSHRKQVGRRPINYGTLTKSDMAQSCALDVADDGPHTLEFVGDLLGVSRERIRQIEEMALKKLKRIQSAR